MDTAFDSTVRNINEIVPYLHLVVGLSILTFVAIPDKFFLSTRGQK